MEIVNENPDSEETMLHLAEDLVSTIQSSLQQEWLVLAGMDKRQKWRNSDESDCTTESGEENVETEVIFSFIDL